MYGWRLAACAVSLSLWACGGNASPNDTGGTGGGAGSSGMGSSGMSGGGTGGEGGSGATGGDSGSGGASGESGSGATGGDSGSGGRAGDAGPGDVTSEQYYPIVSGATWTYSHLPVLNPGPSDCPTPADCWDETVTQTDIDWMGTPALELTDDGMAPNGETTRSVLVRMGTQVLRVHRETSKDTVPLEEVDYEPGFMRFDEAWADMADGTQIDTEYTRVETVVTPGAPNLGTKTTIQRQQRFTIEAHESLDVPAGHIDDCVRVRRVRRGTTMTGLTVDDKDKVFWFCKGIGKVREDDVTSGGHEVLKSCNVPGGACPG